MVSDLAATASFQEKMYERIRDSIGDLMSDEDLKKLTETAVERAFFEPRYTEQRYGSPLKLDSLFVELMRNLLSDRVEKALAAWLTEHPNEIKKLINETIERGVLGLAAKCFENLMSMPMQEFGRQLEQRLLDH